MRRYAVSVWGWMNCRQRLENVWTEGCSGHDCDGEREMIGIFGTKEPDAAWERRVLQRYPILRGSVKYIQIEELPRTMNGKLDYKKLQEYI